MADENKTPWEMLAEQISDPWDWVAAGVGVAGCALVTLSAGGEISAALPGRRLLRLMVTAESGGLFFLVVPNPF